MAIPKSSGYEVRSPKLTQSGEVASLVRAAEASFNSEGAAYTAEDVAQTWSESTFDLERDAWVIEAPDGSLAAYGEIGDAGGEHDWFEAMGWVHPDYRGRGLGTELVARMEERARDLAAMSAKAAEHWVFASAADRAGIGLLEAHGFEVGRQFWHMKAELEEPIQPSAPAGVTVRPFDPGSEVRTMYELMEDTFSEHWGKRPFAYEDWLRILDRSDYDPDLWLVAEADGELAGGLIGKVLEGRGFVDDLGVLKKFRGRGIGTALLERSFETFRSKGYPSVMLNVDSGNETGAVRLYERVGMRVTARFVGAGKRLN
jgi:mycothiol synthase